MLQYKVSELIKQARSKADLQNSDFITHSDDIHILNDVWVDLYQKSIDAGEKYFLKTVENVENGMTLPEDFYQLYSLKTSKGFEIPRRTELEISNGYRGYEIKNNKIYVYNYTDAVVMEYFPTPATLTYPFKPKKYTLSEKYIAGYGNKVYSDCSVLDLETNEVEYFTTNENEKLFQVYKNYIITLEYVTENESIRNAHYRFYDIQTLEKVAEKNTTDYIPLQDTDGTAYIINWSTGKVYSLENVELLSVDVTGTPSRNMVLLDDNRLAVLEGYSCFWNDEGNLFYTDDSKIITILYPEANTTVEAGYTQRGILLCDDPITGNGIWFGNVLYSTSKDIVLNYPNNLFYSAISYRLSVHYKVKQNEDPANLSAMAEEAMYSYFDTITQDDNEPVRIKNVY